ncbi:DUF4870 domain-containing protein [Algoriphagus halophytocola]|uniref:DUF4870 domain-containing protein n=1 Tax=Algoriphagus halophytocola TaxID=2991499 RepID=A0ABY6MHA4_9BACT|nr:MULTISPECIES: DUF4870 domain-containing protein [unclassified Algoriphagus]UZD22864.1 DUF4870 domain-containing protein [Algoriphagus sp. TR-M5]WBL44131.1 DUF4870 domain-containing protein [Algoriphagus sp. TR-M9]
MKHDLEDLVQLDELLKKGVISQDEFEKAKKKILGSGSFGVGNNLLGLNENTYCFLIHIAMLLGFVHVILGLIVPVVLWSLNREQNRTIDMHGKNVINWILSLMIYMGICLIMVFPLSNLMNISYNFSIDISALPSLFSGFLPISILMFLNLVFILIASLKASVGKFWRYPLAIRFFKLSQ